MTEREKDLMTNPAEKQTFVDPAEPTPTTALPTIAIVVAVLAIFLMLYRWRYGTTTEPLQALHLERGVSAANHWKYRAAGVGVAEYRDRAAQARRQCRPVNPPA